MTKVNVSITLSGTVSTVREKDPEAKTRKGSQVGQNKMVHVIQANGLTLEEWAKRFNAATAMLSTGKGAKAPAQDALAKRLKDAEAQIEDLTNQLDEAKLKIEELSRPQDEAKDPEEEKE